MPFEAAWMDLEVVILSEISQIEKEKYHNIPYIWNLKGNNTNELIFNTETDSQTQRRIQLLGRKDGGKCVRQFGLDVYLLLYLKWTTARPYCVQHRELCCMLGSSLDGRGVWGRMDTCVCVTESLCCPPEITTTLLISYVCCMVNSFSPVRLFVTLWTIAQQAPLSMGFSKQEYWSGLPCPPPGDLPNPGIEPVSPVLQEDSLSLCHWGNRLYSNIK